MEDKKRLKKDKKNSGKTEKDITTKEGINQSYKFAWIPLWGWILIFLLPLIGSEFMFYVAGRIASMILFPIGWIGFWFTVVWRSHNPALKIFKKK
jgi:hypothetical protein